MASRISRRPADSKNARRSWTQVLRRPAPMRLVSKPTNALGPKLTRSSQNQTFAFWVEAVAPFRLDLTVWALRRRTSNLIDRWDGHTYRRVLVIGKEPAEVAVSQTGPPNAPRLHVSLTSNQVSAAERAGFDPGVLRPASQEGVFAPCRSATGQVPHLPADVASAIPDQ